MGAAAVAAVATVLALAAPAMAAPEDRAAPPRPVASQPVVPQPAQLDPPPPGSNDWDCAPSEEHPNPVVLVHGLSANQANNWGYVSPRLADAGYCVFSLTYGRNPLAPPPLSQVGGLVPMEQSAEELAAFVDRVRDATGAEKVDIVGHSEGSLMPNYYVKFLGGDRYVDRYVGMTPLWDGTETGGLAFLNRTGQQLGLDPALGLTLDPLCGSCRQFLKGSDFLEKMNSGGGPAVDGVTYTMIMTRYDELVAPYTSGEMDGATNIVLPGRVPERPGRARRRRVRPGHAAAHRERPGPGERLPGPVRADGAGRADCELTRGPGRADDPAGPVAPGGGRSGPGARVERVPVPAALSEILSAGGPVVGLDLTGADLRDADLAGVVLRGCRAAEADLRGARLDNARIDGGTLAGADLREVDLTDAVLSAVDLSGARLAGATLGETRFDGCRMIGTSLRGVRGLAASFRLTGCNLQVADLRELTLRGMRLEECDLSEADLRGADLRETTFERCRLRGSVLRHARLGTADLRTADLGEITPDTPAELAGAIVSPAQAAQVCEALGLTVLE